jgi:hypothetical protein
MKNFIILALSILLFTNCQSDKTKWRYEVRGYVMYQGQKRPAIWYTDTIEIGENYAKYQNSDGSEVVIPAPYILVDHKYDKVIKDTVSAF